MWQLKRGKLANRAGIDGTGLFTPASDANLFIWYRGEDLAGANGSTVATWTDAGGHSRDAASGSVTLDTTGLNGLNVVNAAADSSQMMDLPFNVFGALTEGSAFAVLKRASDPASSSARSGSWHRAAGTDFITSGSHYPFTDGVIYDGFGTNTRKTCGNPSLDLTTWHIVSMHSKASSWELYLNDVQFFSTGTNTVAWTTAPNLFHGESSSYFDGKCAMIVFTSSYGDTTSRQKMAGYLAHHFALQSVLAADQPYKTNPPTV